MEHERQHASVMIQSLVRMFLAYRRVCRLRAERELRAIQLQRWVGLLPRPARTMACTSDGHAATAGAGKTRRVA